MWKIVEEGDVVEEERFGDNLDEVDCPVCNARQRIGEDLEGFICEVCGSEIDHVVCLRIKKLCKPKVKRADVIEVKK